MEIESTTEGVNTKLLETLKARLTEGVQIDPVPPAPVKGIDVVKAYAESLPSVILLPNFWRGHLTRSIQLVL